MKDMFGYEIKEKPVRRTGPKIYTYCRWTPPVENGEKFVCDSPLVTDEQKERGLCERHIYCDDAKKAKAAWGFGKIAGSRKLRNIS
jgi:hypothetical protein